MRSFFFSCEFFYISGLGEVDGREIEQVYRIAGRFELQLWYCHSRQVLSERSLNQQNRFVFSDVKIFLVKLEVFLNQLIHEILCTNNKKAEASVEKFLAIHAA